MTWKGAPDSPENIPQYVGFVYEILEKDTGMVYIGSKLFWKTVKYKPLKGRKNKRHKRFETDWRTYNTSSPIMQQKLEENPQGYEKRIVQFCTSKSDLAAWEAYYQLQYYCRGEWDKLYNECINLRVRIPKATPCQALST